MILILPIVPRIRRRLADLGAIVFVSLVFAPAAHASGSSMPWETPLNQILQSVQGPVAKIMSVIIITMTGLTLAFGDTSGATPAPAESPSQNKEAAKSTMPQPSTAASATAKSAPPQPSTPASATAKGATPHPAAPASAGEPATAA